MNIKQFEYNPKRAIFTYSDTDYLEGIVCDAIFWELPIYIKELTNAELMCLLNTRTTLESQQSMNELNYERMVKALEDNLLNQWIIFDYGTNSFRPLDNILDLYKNINCNCKTDTPLTDIIKNIKKEIKIK